MTRTREKLIDVGVAARWAGGSLLLIIFILHRFRPFGPGGGYDLLGAAAYCLGAAVWARPLVHRYEKHLTWVLLGHFTVDLSLVLILINAYGAPWTNHVYAVASLTIVYAAMIDRPVTGLYATAISFGLYLFAVAFFPAFSAGTPMSTLVEAIFVSIYLLLMGVFSYFAKRTLDTLSMESARSASALEQANLLLRQRMTDLARSDQYKTEFLHMVSHELRTPLNSIIGFSELMLKGLEGPVTPAQREDLESIHRSGKYLLGIVNDILDMAKIQSGDLLLNPERCDVLTLARESAEVLVPSCSQKALSMEVSGPGGGLGTFTVEADPARIRQVFFNLLSNAVKFTDHGGVRIAINEEPDGIVCAVSDTGRGIPSDRIDEVFDPFKQVDSSLNRKTAGTGLGLPIARRLVELHGGSIRVRSQVGRGTTVEFTLPRSLPKDAPRRRSA